MKLRNKKSGEIDDFIFEVITDRIDLYRRVGTSDTKNIWHYNSLAELSAEWEDYEEPKEDYIRVIESFINYVEEADESFCCDESVKKFIEKLKAWKRLKDKGLIFCGTYGRKGENIINFEFGDRPLNQVEADEAEKDLDLLFGGEE